MVDREAQQREAHRLDTLRMAAMESDVVAGRAPFTVFRWGKDWTYVHWSRRPAHKYPDLYEVANDAREERDSMGSDLPVTLELT